MNYKKLISLLICIFSGICLFAQEDPKSVLMSMLQRLNKIHNGSYKVYNIAKPGDVSKIYKFTMNLKIRDFSF